jgi:hypothetical protein
MFGRSVIAADDVKRDVGVKSESFRKWAMDNQWMF